MRRDGRGAAPRAVRNVLELVRDDVETAREAAHRVGIVVRSAHDIAEPVYRRGLLRLEKAEAETERVAGEREHAAELAAAQDADVHL